MQGKGTVEVKKRKRCMQKGNGTVGVKKSKEVEAKWRSGGVGGIESSKE
jgi:hypothetical protein